MASMSSDPPQLITGAVYGPYKHILFLSFSTKIDILAWRTWFVFTEWNVSFPVNTMERSFCSWFSWLLTTIAGVGNIFWMLNSILETFSFIGQPSKMLHLEDIPRFLWPNICFHRFNYLRSEKLTLGCCKDSHLDKTDSLDLLWLCWVLFHEDGVGQLLVDDDHALVSWNSLVSLHLCSHNNPCIPG